MTVLLEMNAVDEEIILADRLVHLAERERFATKRASVTCAKLLGISAEFLVQHTATARRIAALDVSSRRRVFDHASDLSSEPLPWIPVIESPGVEPLHTPVSRRWEEPFLDSESSTSDRVLQHLRRMSYLVEEEHIPDAHPRAILGFEVSHHLLRSDSTLALLHVLDVYERSSTAFRSSLRVWWRHCLPSARSMASDDDDVAAEIRALKDELMIHSRLGPRSCLAPYLRECSRYPPGAVDPDVVIRVLGTFWQD